MSQKSLGTSRKSQVNEIELLRFCTAGSVDDGKSTLIGRLLYDSKQIYEDQLDAIKRASIGRGEEKMNLALITDGLRAEREQGITIDVAYRYFNTPKRKFIIADAPGHIQYTRNMVTAASTADLIIILIDARKGFCEQTYRHTHIASLLRIPNLVFCVNKMDLVNYSQEVFTNIKNQMEDLMQKLNIANTSFCVPVSALDGDNIIKKSANLTWYKGETLLELLENISIHTDMSSQNVAFPVQYVIRPQSQLFHDYRAYAGRLTGGFLKPGDEVVALPSLKTTKISKIHAYNAQLECAISNQSVSISLENDIDISRGDLLVKKNEIPPSASEIETMICWLGNEPLAMNRKYFMKHLHSEIRVVIKLVNCKINIQNNSEIQATVIEMNDIAKISLKLNTPIYYQPYEKNKTLGSFILIDEFTHETIAAGIIL